MADDEKDESPITRRMEKSKEVPPHRHIEIGIEMLSHPDVPDHIVHMAAPILLGVKHFGGPHPEIEKHMNKGK